MFLLLMLTLAAAEEPVVAHIRELLGATPDEGSRVLSGSLSQDQQANMIRMKRTSFRPASRAASNGDYRYYKDMSGKGSNHHIHGPDLPPLCPRVQQHTDIAFSANSGAMDPYGLPCLLEMHWSVEGAPVFDVVRCKRRYQLSGFTDWKCHGIPLLPSRYNMVFHIECVDIGFDGSISGPDFEPNAIANPAWKLFENPENPENPGKDLGKGEKPPPGHYCYLRYALEDNPQWISARFAVIAVGGLGASLMVIGFALASTCAAVVTNTFFAFAIASIAGISFVVIQFSEYLSPEALWWLPASNVAVLIAMTACWMVPIGSDFVRYRFGSGNSGRRRKEFSRKDEEEGIEADDEAGPTLQVDYDELALAISRVQRASADGNDLRPRGDMVKVMNMGNSPVEKKEEEGETKED